jgi:hypothetical protein
LLATGNLHGLGAAVDPEGNHRQPRPDEAGRTETAAQILLLPRKQFFDHIAGSRRRANDRIPGLNRGHQEIRQPVHGPCGRQGVIHAAHAPGSGAVEFPLPGLCRIDRARREEAPDLLECRSLGRNDEARHVVRAELLDEGAKFLSDFGVSPIARDRRSGRVPGKGREKAVPGEVASHGLAMVHLVGLGSKWMAAVTGAVLDKEGYSITLFPGRENPCKGSRRADPGTGDSPSRIVTEKC